MKIGYTVWNWMKFLASKQNPRRWDPMSPYPKRDFEEGLKTISDLGYQTVENFCYLILEYENDPEEFQALLKRYNLEYVNVYNYLTADFDADLEMTRRCLNFMKTHHIPYMNLESPKRPDRPVTKEDVLEIARRANVIGDMAHEAGVTVCLHPHIGTYIESAEEIEWFAQNTDPEKVGFCLDTAHTYLCGMDPVEKFEQYADRIRYVHFKDVDSRTDVEVRNDRFRALGQGIIDFVGVYDVLVKHGYDGIICVELDNPLVSHYQSAKYSRDYLHYVLGF